MKRNKERSPGVSAKRELFEKSSSLRFSSSQDKRPMSLEKSQSVRSLAHPPDRFHSPNPAQRKDFSPKSAISSRRGSIGDVWPPTKQAAENGTKQDKPVDFHKSFSAVDNGRPETFYSPMSVKVKAKMFAGQVKAPDLDLLEASPVKKRNGVASTRKGVSSVDHPNVAGAWPPKKLHGDGESSDRFRNPRAPQQNLQHSKSRGTSSAAGQYRLEAFVSPMPRKSKSKSWVTNKRSPQSGPTDGNGESSALKKTWAPTAAPLDQRFLPAAFRTPQTTRRSLDTRFRQGDLPKIDANENLSPSRVKATHQWISSSDAHVDQKSKSSSMGLPQISVGSMAAQWPQVANQSKPNMPKDRPKDLSPQVPVSTRRTAFESKGGDINDSHEELPGSRRGLPDIDYDDYLDEEGSDDENLNIVEAGSDGANNRGKDDACEDAANVINVENSKEDNELDVDDDLQPPSEPDAVVQVVNDHDVGAHDAENDEAKPISTDNNEKPAGTVETAAETANEGDTDITSERDDEVDVTNQGEHAVEQAGIEHQVDTESDTKNNACDQVNGDSIAVKDENGNDNKNSPDNDTKGDGKKVPLTNDDIEERLSDRDRNSLLQDGDELLLEDSGEYVESDLTTSSEEESYNPKRTGYRIRYDGPTTLPIDRYKPPPIPDSDDRFASEPTPRDTPSLPSRTVDKTPSAPRRAHSGDSNDDDDSTIHSQDSCNRPDVFITPMAGITVENGMWTVRRVWALDEADKDEKDHTVDNSQLFQKIRTLVGAPESPPPRDGAPKLPTRTWKVKKMTDLEDDVEDDDASEMSLREEEMAEGIQTFVEDAAKEEVEIVAKITEYEEKREEKRRRRKERKKRAKNGKATAKDKQLQNVPKSPKSPNKKKKKKNKSSTPKENLSKIGQMDTHGRNWHSDDRPQKRVDSGVPSRHHVSGTKSTSSRKGGRDKPITYSPTRTKGVHQAPVAEIPVAAYVETKKTKISAKPIITRRKKPELGRRSKNEEDKWWKGKMDAVLSDDSSSDETSSEGSHYSSD